MGNIDLTRFESRRGMSVHQLLDAACRESGEREVVYDGTRRMSYSDLLQEAGEIAGGLRRLGVAKGDRVAVCLPGWYEFIVVVFAVARLGAILVPFNTRYRETEAEHILRDSGASVAFFTEKYDKVNHLEQLRAIRSRLDSLKHLISVRSKHDGVADYADLRRAVDAKEVEPAPVAVKEDVFALIYTSGTTGKAKGAMLTHDNLIQNGATALSCIRAVEEDVFLQATPFFHIMGLGAIIRLVISKARMVLLESYHAEKTLQLIQAERITVHPGVPALFMLELNHPAFGSFDLSSLRLAITAGAPCPVELVGRIKREMGCAFSVSYGMTETSPLLTITDLDDDDTTQAETVGRALPGVELRAVDDDRREVAAGAVGELAARGPGVMKGYYNLPELTGQAVDKDGWYYTGDLGTIDEKGYVRIVGRKKDMIIRGGYNVYPLEIEEVLCAHPGIEDAAIVGLPDTVLGEVSCAALILAPGRQEPPQELRDFLVERLADYKVPDHFYVMEEFPRTAVGKAQKFAIRDSILASKRIPLR